MAFPIGVVGALVVGVVGVGTVIATQHDNHSDYTEYSDAAERRARKRREKEIELKSAERKFTTAKENLCEATKSFRCSLAAMLPAATKKYRSGIESVDPEFDFSNLEKDRAALETPLRQRIEQAADAVFADELHQKEAELRDINEVITRINAIQLVGRKYE